MERSEPALIPEWLRCTGGIISSSSHSDALSLRNRSSRSTIDKDNPLAAFLDRSNSANGRRNSGSNGSSKHPYSSFTRSHRDKNRNKEKERTVGRDLWDSDCSDPLANILLSRVEKNTLRRSQSMVSRKPYESFSRGEVESNYVGNFNHSGSNNVLSASNVSNVMGKAVFEKDFPSLGTDEKQGVPAIGRVSSPGLSTVVQSLPTGIGLEGWTSALAEVPAIVSSSVGATAVHHASVSAPASTASSTIVGLNMAEALSQNPIHARTIPQLPDKTQRLEELAIKQSRQLIPMTPPTPKPLVLNSSDKLKHPKVSTKISEVAVAKCPQQQLGSSSQLSNHSPRAGQVRSDIPKTSNPGKFLVLKPVWENGISSSKDMSCSNNSSERLANSQPVVPLSSPTPLACASYPKLCAVDRRGAGLGLNPISNVGKRSSLSQAQSRSDFFNLMRKKTLVNASASGTDSSSAVLSPVVENAAQVMNGDVGAHLGPCDTKKASDMARNGSDNEDANRFSSDGEKNICLNGAVYTDEEEAAFLRSLGWEENSGEDEGLTEEEINAFYQEYMKLSPSLKVCRGAQQKFSFLAESCKPSLGELR